MVWFHNEIIVAITNNNLDAKPNVDITCYYSGIVIQWLTVGTRLAIYTRSFHIACWRYPSLHLHLFHNCCHIPTFILHLDTFHIVTKVMITYSVILIFTNRSSTFTAATVVLTSRSQSQVLTTVTVNTDSELGQFAYRCSGAWWV
jgi:hypothetical protein